MRRSIGGWLAAVATALLLTFGISQSAQAVAVNGFAYQGRGAYSELGDFYEKGLGLNHVRLIIGYDAASNPSDIASAIAWVQKMQARGRQC